MFERSELRISLSTSCAGAERAFVLTQASGKDAIQISSFLQGGLQETLVSRTPLGPAGQIQASKDDPCSQGLDDAKGLAQKSIPRYHGEDRRQIIV